MNTEAHTELEQGGERFRPQWHFSPEKHWINDPNGLVWFEGEYHLFFQYNPFGDQWGHMSWGHAVSADLLHWQELPVAIPEDERVSIFSGSVVVDQHNSSGFGDDTDAVLVAIYTGCKRVPEGGQAQELAYSLDRGRSWTKYAANPVLDIGLRDFRDPKVFWHGPTARWVMAVVRPDDHVVSFYGSHNLREWQHLSDFGPAGEVGGIWECPDLIEFPSSTNADDGVAAHSRWVLKVDTFAGHPGGTGAQVFVGRFDGTRFIQDSVADEAARTTGMWADHGSDFYAAIAWGNLPAHHAAPVWIGWMNNHGYAKRTPTSPWRGAMSVPRELFLRETPAGTRVGQRPLRALQGLRGEPLQWPTHTLQAGETLVDLGEVDGRSLEIEWSVTTATASEFGLQVRSGPGEATLIGVCRRRGMLFIDRQHSGFVPHAERWAGRREVALEDPQGPITLRVLVDRCSVEVLTGDGAAVLTELVFPADASRALRLYALSGEVQGRLTVWPMAATR
ncbi:MAG: glycoside hydrolase family 32 protein [Vitreoscilla sp.]|nr:glycoside hydrolase family 32 protein [Burkholderiales bacterium]MBP6339052.1 glycoside hydrolase family 32 protein [Vitreoscilla sp.]